MTEIFQSIVSALTRAGLEVILVGGWAVNHHGYHRATHDIDFALDPAQKDLATDTLAAIGYTPFSDSQLVTRFSFKEPIAPIVDLLWVDPETHQRLLDTSEESLEPPPIRVIGIRALLAMKLHALRQAGHQRGKDFMDILTLMRQAEGRPSDEEFKDLCEKYGTPQILKELTTLWNL